MRILHILAPAKTGGLEQVVRMLATAQQLSGHDVLVAPVLTARAAEHPFVASLRQAGVRAVEISLPRRAYHRERREVAELCRRWKPDIVHTHGYRPDVISARVAQRAGIPIISTVHGFTGGDWKNRLYEHVQRRSLRKFDAVVAVSHRLAHDLTRLGLDGTQLHVIPNAWPEMSKTIDRRTARSRLEIPEGVLHLGWVGRLSPEKGLDILIEALPSLADLAMLVSIVGDGPQREACRRRARVLGVDGLLRWHGVIQDASRLFAAFDLFVLSSRTEGTPVVLFEAMAAGVPIVAAPVGGVPEMLGQSEAFFFQPEDPDSLANAIRFARLDQDEARARAASAKERLCEVFAVGRWQAHYENVYECACKRKLRGLES